MRKLLVILITLLAILSPSSSAVSQDTSRYLYLARWVWNTSNPDFPYWEAPNAAQVLGLLDLRSIPQMSLAGGTPQGYGLFVYATPQATSGLAFSGSASTSLSTTQTRNIGQLLGLQATSIKSRTITNILWELFTTWADSTGTTRWKPLMPEIDGKLKLYLGGFSSIKEEAYDPTLHPLVLEVLQEDYRRIRADDLVIGSTHYLKVLGAWEQKYGKFGLTYEDFIPADLPKEKPLKPSTTIYETFDTADSDTLGPLLSWTELAGDIDVVSNEARTTGTLLGIARADTDLATDDHYVQASTTVSALSLDARFTGVIFRKDSTTTLTHYLAYIDFQYSSVGTVLYSVASGTLTELVKAAATNTLGTYYLVKGQADGSTITMWRDTVQVLQVTNTAVTGNLRTGIRGRSKTGLTTYAAWDSFEAGDIGGGTPTPTPVPRSYVFIF